MCRQIEEAGGKVTAVYYCPYLEGAPVKAYDKQSDWRKACAGMILQAAADWDIDLASSVMIGDMPRETWSAANVPACRRIYLKAVLCSILSERS